MTCGASNGLHLILSTLLEMNAVIFVDEVTYMIALESICQFSNMKIVSVPLKSDGPDLQILAAEINRYKFEPSENKLFWGMYYTIPTFHNPTGILFSEGITFFSTKLELRKRPNYFSALINYVLKVWE